MIVLIVFKSNVVVVLGKPVVYLRGQNTTVTIK